MPTTTVRLVRIDTETHHGDGGVSGGGGSSDLDTAMDDLRDRASRLEPGERLTATITVRALDVTTTDEEPF